MICHPERNICSRESRANVESKDPYTLPRTLRGGSVTLSPLYSTKRLQRTDDLR